LKIPIQLVGLKVRLYRSGRAYPIPPGKTILATLLDAGVDVKFFLWMGGLRTCETGVLEGVPNHHDNYLSDEEKAGQT